MVCRSKLLVTRGVKKEILKGTMQTHYHSGKTKQNENNRLHHAHHSKDRDPAKGLVPPTLGFRDDNRAFVST
jgi:hypothetical protein